MDETKRVLEGLKDAGVPMKAGEIATKLDMSDKDVAKAIKKLKADGQIDSPKHCYYAPVK